MNARKNKVNNELTYDKEVFTYRLKPTYKRLGDRYRDTVLRKDVFVSLVACGLPSLGKEYNDELIGPFLTLKNSRKPLPFNSSSSAASKHTKEQLLYCMELEPNSKKDRENGRNYVPESEALSYLHFYRNIIRHASLQVNKERFKCFYKKFVDEYAKESNLFDVDEKKLQRIIDKHEDFAITSQETYDTLKKATKDFLRRYTTSKTWESNFENIFRQAIKEKWLGGGVIVLSEYSMPSFRNGKQHLFSGNVLEEYLNELSSKYHINIFSGTKNDCENYGKKSGEKDKENVKYGYCYGVLFSPNNKDNAEYIFKKEHAMSGDRLRIFEDFISYPSVPGLNIYEFDFGRTCFPICADFISPNFDLLLSDAMYSKSSNGINYVFCSARDPSKNQYLYKKLDRPISQWMNDFAMDEQIAKTARNVFIENNSLVFAYVNSLDTASLSAKNRSDTCFKNSLMGFFNVKNIENRISDDTHIVPSTHSLFMKQTVNIEGISPDEALNTELDNINIEIDSSVRDELSAMNEWRNIKTEFYAAYLSLYKTSSRVNLEFSQTEVCDNNFNI